MTVVGERQIVKGRGRSAVEVADALASLLIAELLDPGETLYLVSAWVTDIPILDNSAGTLSTLGPDWDERWLSLSEVLVALMLRGTHVHVKTNDNPHNDAFHERLRARARVAGTEELCALRAERGTHSKGLVGKTFALRGSMNLTFNGMRGSEEIVEIDVGTATVATLRLELSAEWRDG